MNSQGRYHFFIENGQRASVTTFKDAKAVQTVAGSGVLFTECLVGNLNERFD
jgi:hypothetical protein